MSKSIKYLFCCSLFCLFIFGIVRLYYNLTDDFRLSNIRYEFPFEKLWQSPDLTSEQHQELAQLCQQSFFYLGKGAQCYAFESEDQQYVLKFFKFKHLKPSWLINILPSISPFKEFKQRSIERKKRKLIGVFNGYELAYRENRKGSELIYLHLTPTQYLKLQVTVFDKMGLKREINLDDVVFLIQKKGETLRSRLHYLLVHHLLQEAKQSLSDILAMYISEYQKGIYDHDHGVMHNTGFIAGQAFHLDVGKLNKDDRMREVEVYKKDFQQVLWKIFKWVESAHPQYCPDIVQFLNQKYQYWTGETIDLKTVNSEAFARKK